MLRWFCLLFVAGFLAIPAFAASRDDVRLELDYQIYGSGLNALAASFAIHSIADRYALELRAETKGSLGFFFPWHSVMRTQGNGLKASLLPRVHELSSNSRGEITTTFLDYDEAGRFEARRVMPPERVEDSDPTGPAIGSGTVDILSAIFVVMQRLRSGAECNQVVAVFDGKRRYNLVLSDQGWETLAKSTYSVYSGTARRCSVAIQPISGNWKKRQRRWVEGDNPSNAHQGIATIWFASLGEGTPIPAPVRMQIATFAGDFIAHLSRYDLSRLPSGLHGVR